MQNASAYCIDFFGRRPHPLARSDADCTRWRDVLWGLSQDKAHNLIRQDVWEPCFTKCPAENSSNMLPTSGSVARPIKVLAPRVAIARSMARATQARHAGEPAIIAREGNSVKRPLYDAGSTRWRVVLSTCAKWHQIYADICTKFKSQSVLRSHEHGKW